MSSKFRHSVSSRTKKHYPFSWQSAQPNTQSQYSCLETMDSNACKKFHVSVVPSIKENFRIVKTSAGIHTGPKASSIVQTGIISYNQQRDSHTCIGLCLHFPVLYMRSTLLKRRKHTEEHTEKAILPHKLQMQRFTSQRKRHTLRKNVLFMLCYYCPVV